MKSKLCLLAIVICNFLSAERVECHRNDFMLQKAYEGNFSLVHKLLIMRETSCAHDEVVNMLLLAYVYYRLGQYDEVESIFRGIDAYLEDTLLIESE